MLKPLPYPNAKKLVFVERKYPQDFGISVSIPKFNVWRDGNKVLDHMAALSGSARCLWTRIFGGAKDIVGRTVTLGDDPYVVVGVLSPEFKPMPETDIWLPLQPDPNSNNNGHYLRVAARLKSGVSLEPANAQLNTVGEEYRRQFPEWMEKQESVAAVPMQEELSRQFLPTVLVLMGAQHRTRSLLVVTEIALALVLLIGATLLIHTISALQSVDPGFDPKDIVTMQTSLKVQQRTTHEFGVRLSLGATSVNIIKLILIEAFRLTAAGLILGVLGALGLTRLLSSLLFGVRTTDPATFVAVSLVLSVIACVAACIPAHRAIAVNPVIALRME